MPHFDVTAFGQQLQQAVASRDWDALQRLDHALAAQLPQAPRLRPDEVAQLQQFYQALLCEIGSALQQSEQDMARCLQQREQSLAYANVSEFAEQP